MFQTGFYIWIIIARETRKDSQEDWKVDRATDKVTFFIYWISRLSRPARARVSSAKATGRREVAQVTKQDP